MNSLLWYPIKNKIMLPSTPTQHYLVWIKLQRKISLVTSFTLSKWLKRNIIILKKVSSQILIPTEVILLAIIKIILKNNSKTKISITNNISNWIHNTIELT